MRKALFLGLALICGVVGAWQSGVLAAVTAPGMSCSGSILGLDFRVQPPILEVADEQGKLVRFALDSQVTQVMQAGRPGDLNDLQIGQKVEVEAVSQGGNQVARTIHVLPDDSTMISERARDHSKKASRIFGTEEFPASTRNAFTGPDMAGMAGPPETDIDQR